MDSKHSIEMDLVNRAIQLIHEHSLTMFPSKSIDSIGCRFWTDLFERVFGISPDLTLRNKSERLRACISALELKFNVSLNHIKPERLLDHDIIAISNMLELVEVWNQYGRPLPASSVKNLNLCNSKASRLTDQLHTALQNQIIALEIETKIKEYLGDVTGFEWANRRHAPPMRACRKSILRTRAIQPTALTFDFQLTDDRERNPILSFDLERCFSLIADNKLQSIRTLERRLLLLEQKSPRIYLAYVIQRQHRREELEFAAADTPTVNRERLNRQAWQRQVRTQRAMVQNQIERFHRLAKAAYLRARSHLERILVEEFKKLDHHRRNHLDEIRKYIETHPQMDVDMISNILENLQKVLAY